ncbi:hypothetical protein J4N45_10155 [Vibrio sp. SCSIO 43140]|uniref:hypothetical protein n=1 Tax=Vibrio sp. SCSIO 43140 TaxID=2819100 RepID=UPI002074EB36|nr:hypothetical protein [Vibrio sp. SCSIO 43140]USD58892.1 hypothetical protein J4N45_10155 [Vibrio sp. SCSIO 43140]
MRVLLILGLLITTTSAAEEIPTSKDLLERRIANLEVNVIDAMPDLYEEEAVNKALRQHQEYLMLCSNKLATSLCEQAMKQVHILRQTANSHLQLNKDMNEMWALEYEMRMLERGSKQKEVKGWGDFYKSLGILPLGPVSK